MALKQEVWDAERIKGLRTFLGVSQEHMARTLNCEQKTISRWETGKRHPVGHTLRLLTLLAERVGYIHEAEARRKVR